MRKILIAFLSILLLLCCVVDLCLTGALVFPRLFPTATLEASPTLEIPPTTMPPATKVPTPTPTATATIVASPTTTVSTSKVDPETLLLLERTVVPPRDPYALAPRLKHLEGPIPKVVNQTPPQYDVGTTINFWVQDEALSDTYFPISATLIYKGSLVYMWMQSDLDLDEEALEEAGRDFEENIYPTNHRFFGQEWSPGVDNDPRIHILNANLPSVGGYYYSIDEYPRVVNPFSNEKELININAVDVPPGAEYYHATMAHEFAHMIYWNMDSNEADWVNEGSGDLAAKLNGYETSVFAFPLSPDTQLNAWTGDIEEAGPHYDAAFLFMEYFAQRFGAELVRELTATPADGIAGFDQVLRPQGLTFDGVFQDWVIANYLDEPSLGDGRYGYDDVSVWMAAEAVSPEYPVDSISTVHQYAADYLELEPSGKDSKIEFQGSTSVKIMDNEPHSGDYQWWSNRGDASDMTLTRAFDLTNLNQATLEAWLWYDIEEDFDYAYVEVSRDGGQTYDILETAHTTDTNPYGNNWGHGYTGLSGGGERPQWVKEVVDLSPYAGKEILLRFEYITDDVYNAPGFAVDDISVPELDYYYDAETDDGWVGEGFVRIKNILPQDWNVQVIEYRDGQPRVVQVSLDENERGEYIIRGTEVERAVIVIAAMAPSTTEVGGYLYSIEELGE